MAIGLCGLPPRSAVAAGGFGLSNASYKPRG
jgi:hypothetical protein